MSKEKFTQGEWKIVDEDDFEGFSIGIPAGVGYYHIASAKDVNNQFDDEMLANAHLISAAPDMYRFIESLVEFNNIDEPLLDEKALSLLAKARGEF